MRRAIWHDVMPRRGAVKMRRRDLVALLTSAAALRTSSAAAQSDEAPADGDIDPYFLDSGELTDSEQDALIAIEQFHQQQMQGDQVVIPRGLRPPRAPTYRLVHWSADVNDRNGRFVSPLSVQPVVGALPAYRVNGQILGFRGAGDDWGGRSREGTLTVELRTSVGGEPMTWFYAQQFDMDGEGFTNLGYDYVAQRDGMPQPAISDQPNVGLRIQLLRSPRRAAVLLRKFLRAAILVSGTPVGQSALRLPPVRVPAMLQEGAALAQALIGGTAEETPLWRGGFSSYGIAAGASRLGLVPGYWMVIDGEREPDLRGVMLEDLGGTVAPTRDGERLDVNYLVLAFEVGEASVPAYLSVGRERFDAGPPRPRTVPDDFSND
jgi:hypothetical protein